MKSETEIKEKLEYYEAVLAGIESEKVIDDPELLLRVSRHFPVEAIEMLNNLGGTEKLAGNIPPEDRSWIRESFGSLTGSAHRALNNRISILRWVLERAGSDGEG